MGDRAEQYINEGAEYAKLGQYAEALASFDKAIKINPDDADVWVFRGVALGDLGLYEDAIISFERAIAINADYTDALFFRGVALGILGRHEDAVASFRKVLSINPEYPEARKNLEIVLEQQENEFHHDRSRVDHGAKPTFEPDLIQNPLVPWAIGYKIQNRYEIVDIKSGGMGIVYFALDHEWDQIFAIKTFQEQYLWDEDAIQRFTAEAEIWIDLERHTNIVFASFIQKIEGKPLIFLDFIDSGDLNQFIGKLNIEESLDFAIQFCTGMEYAYQKLGVIHRDIKPANVMVQKDSRFKFGYAYKITDFGLVKVLSENPFDESVRVLTGMGTLPFMSPEQCPERIQEKFSFNGQVTTRSDVYSFGVTLYLLLTGKLPFVDMDEIFTKYPERPTHLNPEIPEHLDSLILKCLEKNPNNRYNDFTELKFNLIKIFNNNTGKNYEVVGGKEPFSEVDWSNKGLALDTLGKYQEAIKCYDKALEINPALTDVWSNKGNTFKNLGKTREAIGCYDKALEINPRNVEAWCNKGIALGTLGKYQEAIKCYDTALEINPRHTDVWSNKGNALAKLGNFQDAIECSNHALQINPRNDVAWYNKGRALSIFGKYQEAIECSDHALQINPRNAAAWYSKGNALAKLGKLQEAIECYDKFLEINPRDVGVWSNKGNTFKNLGKSREAIGCYDKALEINPKSENAWKNKGIALYDLGNFQEAIECFEKFIEYAPSQDASLVEQAKQIIKELRG